MRHILLSILLLPSLVFIGCTSGGDSGGGDPILNNACDVVGLPTRIIDGSVCGESNSPIVRLVLLGIDGGISTCSGTMLSSDDILTAAHCYITTPIIRSVAEVEGKEVAVSQVIVHPDVRLGETTIVNDVAIVRLQEPLTNATLPLFVSGETSGGDTISIFGYGLDRNDTLNILQSGQMRVDRVTNEHVFAEFNGEGSNTCQGDSGGPAIIVTATGQPAIAGVLSTGEQIDCLEGDTSVFANTQKAAILDFISQVVPEVGLR